MPGSVPLERRKEAGMDDDNSHDDANVWEGA
jgi:hypothetical protein